MVNLVASDLPLSVLLHGCAGGSRILNVLITHTLKRTKPDLDLVIGLEEPVAKGRDGKRTRIGDVPDVHDPVVQERNNVAFAGL